MKKQYSKHNVYLYLIFIISTLTIGCSTIKLVGDYDEKIDQGVTALQKLTEIQLLAIEEGANYASGKAYYDTAKVEVSVLRVRADATERNSLTVKMLDLLGKNIKRLEKAHKSEEGINPGEVKDLFRGGFNSQFTAILTFELAKMRGEKPDPNKASKAPTPNTTN